MCVFQQRLHVLRDNFCFVFKTKVAFVPARPHEEDDPMHEWGIHCTIMGEY